MPTIQFFSAGVEYTTRYELAQKYTTLGHNKLQRILEGCIAIRIEYKNQFYFDKAATEAIIETMLKNNY